MLEKVKSSSQIDAVEANANKILKFSASQSQIENISIPLSVSEMEYKLEDHPEDLNKLYMEGS
jgi:hypothetical protein